MTEPEINGVPDGAELFEDSSSNMSLGLQEEWMNFAVLEKPDGGKDARNHKKE